MDIRSKVITKMNQCNYLKKIDDNNYIKKYLKRSMIINDDNK